MTTARCMSIEASAASGLCVFCNNFCSDPCNETAYASSWLNLCTYRNISMLQAFELQGVIARDAILRLLQAGIGLLPVPDDRQVRGGHGTRRSICQKEIKHQSAVLRCS